MENNLKQMSIKDYFKYLYDHIVENLKIGKWAILKVILQQAS